MKNLSIIAAVVTVTMLASFTNQDDKKALARVRSVQGKEVYVMSEPLREYQIVEDINTFGTTKAIGGNKVSDIVDQYIWKANRKGVEYDALLIDGSNKASLIKFK